MYFERCKLIFLHYHRFFPPEEKNIIASQCGRKPFVYFFFVIKPVLQTDNKNWRLTGFVGE